MSTNVINKVAGTADVGARYAWPSIKNTKQFAAGIGDVASSATFNFNPGPPLWYAQAFIMPVTSGTITSINMQAGDTSAVSNRIGWALYDGVSLNQLDSGVYTLSTSAVAFRNISVSVPFDNNAVILALKGGTDGVGNSNLEMDVVDNPQQVFGLPTVHTAISVKTILPFLITGSDYSSAPATATVTSDATYASTIHLCSLTFS